MGKNIHAVELGKLGVRRRSPAQLDAWKKNAENMRARRWIGHVKKNKKTLDKSNTGVILGVDGEAIPAT
jgi:hypothetical protein